MKKPSIIAGSALLLLLVVGVSHSVWSSSGDEGGIDVSTTQARLAGITQRVNATGRIQPKRQVKISADVSARITRIPVAEGEQVVEGQLLVELDRLRYEASVDSQEANVRAAQGNAKLVLANMQQAERVLKRATELFAKKIESQATVDSARAAYQVELARHASALDQIEQAKGQLRQAREDLSRTTIYSPMSGTVIALEREPGEIAIGSQFQEDVIMIVADLDEMQALVSVDENDIARVALGQDASIKVDALLDGAVAGRVSEIASSAKLAPSGETQQKTEFEVRIAVTSADAGLRTGMTTNVDIVTASKEQALAVPIQSVTVRTLEQLRGADGGADGFTAGRDGFVPIVFVVEDGIARARQVKTGIHSDDLIEILDGLSEGEQVVSGSYRAISRDLAHGQVVVIEQPAALAGAP